MHEIRFLQKIPEKFYVAIDSNSNNTVGSSYLRWLHNTLQRLFCENSHGH